MLIKCYRHINSIYNNNKNQMNKIINVINNRINEKCPPVWIMRQAGRYLPEYLQIRNKVNNFLDLCYNPVLASEVTLQPITRFNLDAAIIFSDILVIPDALGIKVDFIKNHGPVLDNFDITEVNKLKIDTNFFSKLQPVLEAINLTKAKLNKDTALIGFAGAPFTLACYIIQGGSAKNFDKVKQIMHSHTKEFSLLIDVLTDAVIAFLEKQILTGVDIVKIFDSWAGILPYSDLLTVVIEPAKKIVNYLNNKFPQIPVIYFPKNIGTNYANFIDNVKCQVLAIDQNIDSNYVKQYLQKKAVIQGNLDNFLLAFADREKIKIQVQKIIDNFNDQPFIFNLGHGILPQTPIENVELVLNIIRNQ